MKPYDRLREDSISLIYFFSCIEILMPEEARRANTHLVEEMLLRYPVMENLDKDLLLIEFREHFSYVLHD